jgi:hypothetical protein
MIRFVSTTGIDDLVMSVILDLIPFVPSSCMVRRQLPWVKLFLIVY